MSVSDTSERFHAFDRLVLTISERASEGVSVDRAYELRARWAGAEVWCSSALRAGSCDAVCCEGDRRFVGSLTSRQVIDLLEEIERSGVYESPQAFGVEQDTSGRMTARVVSMHVVSAARVRQVLDRASAERSIVHDVMEAVRRRVDVAMERALTNAG